MRQLNRLNQYHRLWQPSKGATQQVTISELVDKLQVSADTLRRDLSDLEKQGLAQKTTAALSRSISPP